MLQPLMWRPQDPMEAARWEMQSLCWRMLYGVWDEDLKQWITQDLGPVRAANIGKPDLSSNALKSRARALAVLFDLAPRIPNPDRIDQELLTAACLQGGVWQTLARNQRDVQGIGENLVFLDAGPDGTPRLQLVPPHLTLIEHLKGQPDEPGRIEWFRTWKSADGSSFWVRLVWDIRDPSAPTYQVWSEDGRTDRTLELEGATFSGDAYPWRFAGGSPFIPLELYHANWHGQLWDAWENREIVDGTLRSGVMWTHCARTSTTATWAQKYAIGVDFGDADADGSAQEGARYFPVAPDSIMAMEPHPNSSVQPSVGTFQPAVRPQEMYDVADKYEQRQIANGGINGTDFMRVSGKPESGYGQALNQEAKRELARRQEPADKRSTKNLVAKLAALYRMRTGYPMADTGWDVRYTALPPSAGEREATRLQIEWEDARGFVSPLEAYRRLNPGASADEALEAIVNAALEKARLKLAVQQALQSAGLAEPAPEKEGASGVIASVVWSIVGDVTAGTRPRDSGIGALVEVIGLSPEKAEVVMASAGKGAPPAPQPLGLPSVSGG